MSTKPELGRDVAALIIDMQEYFLNNISALHKNQMIHEQEKLLEYCASADILVLEITWANDGPTVPQIMEKIARAPRFLSLMKESNSAFLTSQPSLDNILDQHDVRGVIVAGINASYCVLDTAQDAARKGYEVLTTPHLIQDPLYEHKIGDYDATLQWFRHSAELYLTTQELLTSLKKATHDKHFSKQKFNKSGATNSIDTDRERA